MTLTLQQLKHAYEKGGNVTALLREQHQTTKNDESIIEVAYDIQAGSYIDALNNEEFKQKKDTYNSEIASTLQSLCQFNSLMEAGVGEATTLCGVLNNIRHAPNIAAYGFDISWSRVALGQQWMLKQNIKAELCVGSLFHVPFADNSIDVVYTAHTIEPNRGKEDVILQELYRVARKYLVLFEPSYELGIDESRARMDRHGYCRNLLGSAQQLGYNVTKHELFEVSLNPLNPTGVTIIEKNVSMQLPRPSLPYACPQYGTPLSKYGNVYYSEEALVMYPIIRDIPCLRRENGIVATKFLDVT